PRGPESSFSTIGSSSRSAVSTLTAAMSSGIFWLMGSDIISPVPSYNLLSGPEQRFHMRIDAFGQPLQIIAAFEQRHDAPPRMQIGRRHQVAGDPAVVLAGPHEIGERVLDMCIESGGDEEKLRAECMERRQDGRVIGFAKLPPARPGGKRHIDDIANAALAGLPGAGVKGRRLMGGGVKDARILLKNLLRAVAVMNV